MAEGYINKDHERFILLDQQNNGNDFDDTNIPNLHGYMVTCNTGYIVIGYKGTNLYSCQIRFGYWENSLWFRRKYNSDTWSEWKYASFI